MKLNDAMNDGTFIKGTYNQICMNPNENEGVVI